MSTRHRKNHKIYEQHTKKVQAEAVCQFCDFDTQKPHVLSEHQAFWVVENLFPYDVWDGSNVSHHLMVVPKRHVDSIAHFTDQEKREYVNVLAEYERQGYSIYARAPGSAIKSVIHQHTHLIKIDNSVKKFLLFMRRPRMLLTR